MQVVPDTGLNVFLRGMYMNLKQFRELALGPCPQRTSCLERIASKPRAMALAEQTTHVSEEKPVRAAADRR